MTVKAHCDDCNDTVTITPTGRRRNPDKGTDEWWEIVSHKNKQTGDWCPGSKRLV